MCLSTRIEECLIDSENTLDLGYPHDNCDYCDISDTSDLNLTDSDLVCVQWNIRGILGKQGDVSNFLFDCMGKKKIDVVILVETWLTKSLEKKLNIPGYNFVGNHREGKKGGGVGFLISEELKYLPRTDLHCKLENFENCTIEVISPKKNILIGSVYRPPNTTEKLFIDNFSHSTSKVHKEKSNKKKDLILGLDHNLDLLKCDKHPAT